MTLLLLVSRQMHAERPVQLVENLGVGDGLTVLVFLNDLRPLVAGSCQLCLRHLLGHSRGGNGLGERLVYCAVLEDVAAVLELGQVGAVVASRA